MTGRCCVFQPFDKGPHDKRYEDVVVPAIKAAGLEPYRVDQDDEAIIPIEKLHEEIRNATICLADVTTNNPNVMYELGFAIASNKEVVIISSTQREPQHRYPFDIQHRGIIQYAPESPSDFVKLKESITSRLQALLKRQEGVGEIISVSPVKSTRGLLPHQIATLAFLMANRDADSDFVTARTLKLNMADAGYTAVATSLALTYLSRINYIEAVEDYDFNNNPYFQYVLLKAGEDWLLENQDTLELRLPEKPTRQKSSSLGGGLNDSGVPF
jgi:hypothetical protein